MGVRTPSEAEQHKGLLAEVEKWSPEDRLDLIGAVWDTLLSDDLLLTQEEKVLLDERLEDLHVNPAAQSPWPAVKARLAQRRR